MGERRPARPLKDGRAPSRGGSGAAEVPFRERAAGSTRVMAYLFSDGPAKTSMPYPPFHPSHRGAPPSTLDGDAFAAAFPGEDEFIEFKTGVSPPRIQEVATAFSNTDGGVMVIGVADDRRIVGVRDPGERMKDVYQALRDVQNPGRHEVHQVTVDGEHVLILGVSRRREGFAQTSAGVVFVRKGASNAPLIGTELSAFVARRAFASFESTPTNVVLDDADSVLRSRLCDAHGWIDDEHLVDRLKENGFVSHDRSETVLTVAGGLVLLPEPEIIGGRPYIDMRRFSENQPEPNKTWEIRGPIDQQIETAVAAISDELGTVSAIVGAHRVELPRLPTRALREVVANAVAHRSYEDDGTAIRIEIHPTRVSVTSPGGLPEPVTIEHIRSQQAARNDRILRTLRRFKLAEDKGLGIDRIEDDMAAELLHAPEFSTDGSFFTVDLRLDGVVTTRERAWVRGLIDDDHLDPRSALVVVAIARDGSITNGDVRELLNVDSTEARAVLQALVQAEIIVMFGTRGGAEYRIAPAVGIPSRIRYTDSELDEIALARAARGRLTNAALRAETGLNPQEALKVFRRLLDRNLLVQRGTKRGTHYVRPEDV